MGLGLKTLLGEDNCPLLGRPARARTRFSPSQPVDYTWVANVSVAVLEVFAWQPARRRYFPSWPAKQSHGCPGGAVLTGIVIAETRNAVRIFPS